MCLFFFIYTQVQVIVCLQYKCFENTLSGLIDWIVCYAAFNSISVSSHYSCLSQVSPVLGWALKRLAQGHSHKKPRGSSAVRTQDPWFTSQTLYHWAMRDPENTLRKGELFVMSNFSFSHRVLCPFWEPSAFSSHSKLSSENSFSLEESKICCLGKG